MTSPASEFRLKPSGLGRFFNAGFMLVWLGFWCMGEAAAASALVAVTTTLLGLGPRNFPGAESAVAMGLFFLVWCGFWTIGGFAACHAVLRLLWSEDRIEVADGALVHATRTGPFRRSRRFERAAVRRIDLREKDSALVAETASGPVVLTTYGTPAERAAIRDTLHEALALPSSSMRDDEDSVATPDGWESEAGPGGSAILRAPLALRRQQATFTFAIFAILSTWLALGLVPHLRGLAWTTQGAALAAGLASLDALLFVLGVWLAVGRTELVVGAGRVTRRRSFGERTWSRTLSPASLVLEQSQDSDGDDRFSLIVEGGGDRLTLESSITVSRPLVHLGRWVGARVGAPLRVVSLGRGTERRRVDGGGAA